MSEEDFNLRLEASALAAMAESRIIAELGPRALPTRRTEYEASARAIVDEVFEQRWTATLTLTSTGEPRIMTDKFNG